MMKVKKLTGVLGILALLSLLVMPMAVFAADDTDSTTVDGNPPATIETTITGSITSWTLSVGSNEDTTSIDMNVKCNTGTWNVKVKEVVDGNNAADGKMAAWNGTGYVASGEVMETAIQVKSGAESYVSLNSTAQQIQSGSATETAGTNYDIGIKQTVNYGDLVLSGTDVYRITITFESNLPA